MEQIFIRESQIFTRQWKKEDILKIIQFKEKGKRNQMTDDEIEEIDDKKIKIEEYKDLFDKFSSLFNQMDIDQLKNNYQMIIEYFYIRELTIELYVSEKYIDNDNKRLLNLRVVDSLLRIQFEENEAIKEEAKSINRLISEINETYFKKDNLEDLSDQTYMKKMEKVLGTKDIPHFLMREGLRIIREIKKNKELFIKNAEAEFDENTTDFSEKDNCNFSDNEDNIVLNNEIYDIKDIINEIEKNKMIPFGRMLKEVYISLFFLALKEIKNDELFVSVKNNINIFIDYFQIETYKTFEEFKKIYIDIDASQISYDIISLEFSDINKSEYACKYIIASYKVLINKVFNNSSYVYINLLLFLQNYISQENKLFKKIIENEINSHLLLNDEEKSKNSAENDDDFQKTMIVVKKYNYQFKFQNQPEQKPMNQQNNYQNQLNNNKPYPEQKPMNQQNNYQNQLNNNKPNTEQKPMNQQNNYQNQFNNNKPYPEQKPMNQQNNYQNQLNNNKPYPEQKPMNPQNNYQNQFNNNKSYPEQNAVNQRNNCQNQFNNNSFPGQKIMNHQNTMQNQLNNSLQQQKMMNRQNTMQNQLNNSFQQQKMMNRQNTMQNQLNNSFQQQKMMNRQNTMQNQLNNSLQQQKMMNQQNMMQKQLNNSFPGPQMQNQLNNSLQQQKMMNQQNMMQNQLNNSLQQQKMVNQQNMIQNQLNNSFPRPQTMNQQNMMQNQLNNSFPRPQTMNQQNMMQNQLNNSFPRPQMMNQQNMMQNQLNNSLQQQIMMNQQNMMQNQILFYQKLMLQQNIQKMQLINQFKNYQNLLLKQNIIQKQLQNISYPEQTPKYQQNNHQRQNTNEINDFETAYTTNKPKKYHTTKHLDLYSIKNIMDNDYNLNRRFNEVVREEELYEEGSCSLKFGIIGFFKKLFRMKESENEDTIKKHLKLIPYKMGTFEDKNILILISGYLSSESDQFKDWQQLINVYKNRFNNPIIYFFNWPSSSFGLKKLVFHRKDFRDSRERGRNCGRLLALMIMSNIFDGFKINLSAFSLGNHVLKHCLKELENFGKLDLINNVVFMAGATDIKCNFKWEHRLGAVTGTIVNCYSDHDLALWYCRNITGKDTIGTKKLKFAYVTIINRLISSYHVLYRLNMDKLWNMFINDLKE